MHTIYRAALASLLLTLLGCSSVPTQESSKSLVQASEQAPKAAEPTRVSEPMPVPMPAPEPVVEAPQAPEPARVAAVAQVEVAKPAVKPVSKPAPVAKTAAKPPIVETTPPPETAVVGNISGSLKLVAGQGQSVSTGEVSEGLVYFLPKAGSPKPKPGRFVINTRSKGFSPETLVVPQGSTVRFPNVDTIIHNVYSRSPGNSFDLGYYAPGKSPEFTFNTAGLAIVNCTVHHTMRANVVVLATPYYARPGKDGRYQIKGVPPGPGTLVFWHPRAAAKSLQANAPLAAAATQTLVASKSPQVH
ncbi:MAG: hypothetical protein ACOH1L_03410 [Thermomonas sp.]